MADFVNVAQFSPAFATAIRALFGGERDALPPFGPPEVHALAEHGIDRLVYRLTGEPQLRAAAMAGAALEPLRLADLQRVLEALADRQVTPLILKGTALAYTLYPAPDLRPRCDTDLLIPIESLPAAREAFRQLGFSERLTSGDQHGVRQFGFDRSDDACAYVYDVHVAISNSAVFAGALTYDELRERARAIPAINDRALGLANPDALLLSCIHRVAHHYDSERLIWLYDVQLLRDSMTRDEHAAFWARASEKGLLSICRRSVDLAGQWFSHGPDDGTGEKPEPPNVEAEERSRVFLDRSRSRAALLMGDLAALPRWRERLQRCWQLAFPPRAFMLQSFGQSRARIMPLLYVYRGIRGVARLFRRVA